MAIKGCSRIRIEKIDEMDTGEVFRLIHPRWDGVEICFTRRNFQEVMRSFDFTSGEIGAVLRMLNKKYPVVHEFTISHFFDNFGPN